MFNRLVFDNLTSWAASKQRKPLIIRGARQVGKTTLVKMFSKKYDHFVHLNLERKKDKEVFDRPLSAIETIQAISVLKNTPLQSNSALLFIDEIQASPAAISLLRYFHEEVPSLHIIAAGSLLESMIGKKQISFPVGRVEYLFLYPVSFGEFLQAKKQSAAYDAYQQMPVPSYAHTSLLALHHEYVMVGGMPEIVQSWIDQQDLLALKPLFRNLFTSYSEDVSKYARSNSMIDIIRHTINTVHLEAGKRITFQGFGHSNYRSREIGEALRALEQAMLLTLIYPSTNVELPFLPNKKKKPKLLFLDTGMINYRAGILDKYLGLRDISALYQGRIIEHIVGQELLCALANEDIPLRFWAREKKQSQAELDFCICYKGHLVPIETKSGSEGKLRSLHQFMMLSNETHALRLYAGTYEKHLVTLPNGKTFTLINLPYYCAGNILPYLEMIF